MKASLARRSVLMGNSLLALWSWCSQFAVRLSLAASPRREVYYGNYIPKTREHQCRATTLNYPVGPQGLSQGTVRHSREKPAPYLIRGGNPSSLCKVAA